ncbi:3725_t:CDS:2 [Dentiscutata heterogama]|uniref:3725_t:CDS:1 n=1 Tax=Dentiscutata heterogama TaxID=1316150 RepID=A0ACA9M2R8_9GLOM|nr:3725_t:CDS:2 [Dentiscutata heterogama]
MSSKQKNTLSDAQKYELCLYAHDNKLTHAKYIDWIEKKWDKRLTTEIVNPEKRKNKAVTVPAFELALKEFVLTYQHKTILSNAMLIKKARLLANGLGVPEGTLNFFSG